MPVVLFPNLCLCLKIEWFYRGEDDYLPGNITEIELHNFMTFSYLKCKPGSRLNLVIGPNGSGKSSIVCAIALGLGGDPQVCPIHLNHKHILLYLM